MQIWSSNEITFLTKHVARPTKEIFELFCDEFGTTRSYDSVQKKVLKLRDAYADIDIDDEEEAVACEMGQLLNAGPKLFQPIPAEKKAQLKIAAKEWLEGLVEATSDIPLPSPKNNGVQSKKSSLVLCLSDTHFGKQTPYFNLDIAKKRLLSIPNRLLSNPGMESVDEIVVLLIGDMVEGEDIYPTQANHIECSAIEQVKACTESIWTLLVSLQTTFKVPVRVECAPGNHGRVSKTANEQTNWDNVVYHILNVMGELSKNPKVVINCNFEEFRVLQIKDKTCVLYHHGVKHTGTPAMREKVAGWSHSKNFDVLVHGHWHEWHVGNWLGRYIVGNGCMCGPDDLAERLAREDTARQAYFFVTPDKPIWGFSFVEW